MGGRSEYQGTVGDRWIGKNSKGSDWCIMDRYSLSKGLRIVEDTDSSIV